jgi:hypothetical protein
VFFAKAEKSSLVLCFIELKGTKHNSVKNIPNPIDARLEKILSLCKKLRPINNIGSTEHTNSESISLFDGKVTFDCITSPPFRGISEP